MKTGLMKTGPNARYSVLRNLLELSGRASELLHEASEHRLLVKRTNPWMPPATRRNFFQRRRNIFQRALEHRLYVNRTDS